MYKSRMCVVDFKTDFAAKVLSPQSLGCIIIISQPLALNTSILNLSTTASRIPPKHLHVPIFHPDRKERPALHPPTRFLTRRLFVFPTKLVRDVSLSVFSQTLAKPRQTLDAADKFPGDWTLRELQHRISHFLLLLFFLRRRRRRRLVASPSRGRRTVVAIAISISPVVVFPVVAKSHRAFHRRRRSLEPTHAAAGGGGGVSPLQNALSLSVCVCFF